MPVAPIPHGIYAIENFPETSYVTGGRLGALVVLEPVGHHPPKDSQKFEAVYDSNKDAYRFLQVDSRPRHGPRHGLSFDKLEDHAALVIGPPRHFSIVEEIFGGDHHFGLVVYEPKGVRFPKYGVGVPTNSQELQLLDAEEAMLFRFVKVG